MTNKNTKRALLTSVMSLLLCFTMLLGTTYAWFTDSVSSANNLIVAGNLDVELKYAKVVNGQLTDWETVAGNEVFDSKALWEPGRVEVVYLEVSNLGTLALKYQLGVNVYNEFVGKTENGEDVKLSDHLVFKVVEMPDALTTYTDREAVAAAAGTEKGLKDYNGKTTALEVDGVDYVALIVYMPETVGNEANYKTGTTVPQITLGVNLYATQLANESDSFGNDYDADAIHTDFIVTSEAELVEALANAKHGAVIGIKGNVTWTTGAGIGSTPFAVAPTTSTLSTTPPTISALTFVGLTDDATFTAIGSGVGAIGIDNGTVTFKNLTIADQSVSYAENSWEYGYLEFRGNTVFDSCNIVNAIMMEGTSASFKNCSFNSHKDSEYAVWVSDGNVTIENCLFTGTRGVKIHEAYDSEVGTVVINNNRFMELSKKPGLAIGTVNAKTTVVLTNNTFAGTQAGDQGLYSYETDTDVATFDFVCADNIVGDYADTNAELKNQLQNNATVVLPEGEYTLPSMSGKEGITIIGAADGSTVVGGTNTSTGFGSNFGKNTTIQNVTFSGKTNGVRYSYAQGGTSTFDNCTFAGDSTYGFHIDQSNGATFIFNNCTFVGFNAFAGDLEKVVFNNCTFLSNGNYGHTNIWSVAELNNCTFGDNTSISTKNKLIVNGVEENYHHEYIGSAESLFAFAKSVNEGGDSWTNQAVVLVADIDLENTVWTPIGQTGATQFKGIFDGNGYTIKNLYVDSSAQTGGHYSSGLFGWAESNVTIKNVKIDGAKVVGNHNVAAIVGYTYSGKISNCSVINAEIVCTHANDDACGDKCGLIAGYAGNESRISNCSASNSTVKAGRDAGQLIGCGYNVSVSNCTATDVTVTAGGNCTGANIRNEVIGRVMG